MKEKIRQVLQPFQENLTLGGQRWVDDGAAVCLLNTSQKGTLSRVPMPHVMPSGALERNIPVIPLWADFFGNLET